MYISLTNLILVQLILCFNRSNLQMIFTCCFMSNSWWRYQMETLSALLAICAGNSPVTGEFPSKRPVTRSFDVFFDLCLNKRLSKQSRGWWFQTPWRPLWRHCNVTFSAEYWVGGVRGFSKVVATFNHVCGPSIFRIWGYVLHFEHISCVITNCG